jgi:thiosulfate reductase cytochrome b subunit
MAGQGGPDEETWKKMSPMEKKIYWAIVTVIVSLMVIAGLYKLLS